MSAEAVRAFVAVRLPERVRAGLAAVSAELRGQTHGLAWVRADNLHLTLRFLGAIEPAMLEPIRQALVTATAAIPAFTVRLGGLGGFPSGRAPRVLWASVTVGSAELGTLYAALETALVARGLPGESRVFHPHVTLARARDPRGAGDLVRVLGEGPAFGEVRVGTIHLMRSDLDPRGSRYSVLFDAPLTES